MNELARVLVIGGAVGVALLVAALWTDHQSRALRRSLDTGSLRPFPVVVLFTSTDCDSCAPVRELVLGCTPGGLVREIAYEGGAEQFRSVGVDKVPVVLVINGRGTPVDVFEGHLTERRMERALRRAGVR